MLEPGESRAVSEFMDGLTDLVARLVDPARDGGDVVHVALVDDMTVNAAFLKLKNGGRVVFVNLGLVRFAQSDDELASVIGHELEHGASELQGYADELAKTGGWEDKAAAFLLRRAVENEVDAKSVYYRVLRHGYDPYALVAVLERMRRDFGDGIGVSHTAIESRIQTLGLALAALARERGELMRDEAETRPARREVVGPLKEGWLGNENFHERQRALFRIILTFPDIRSLSSLQSLESGPAHNPYIARRELKNFIEDRWKAVERRMTGLVSEGEMLRLRMEFLSALGEAVTTELSHLRVFETPQPTARHVQLADAYLAYDYGEYFPCIAAVFRDIGETEKKRAEADARIRKGGSAEELERTRSEIRAIEARLESLRARFKLLKGFYRDLPEDVLTRAVATRESRETRGCIPEIASLRERQESLRAGFLERNAETIELWFRHWEGFHTAPPPGDGRPTSFATFSRDDGRHPPPSQPVVAKHPKGM